MPEETFRQERKPISMSEINAQSTPSGVYEPTPTFTQPTLKNVESTRQALAQEMGMTDNPQMQRVDPSAAMERPFTLPPNAPRELLDRIRGVSDQEDSFEQQPQRMSSKMQQPQRNSATREAVNPPLRLTGSEKLEALIDGIKDFSHVYEPIQLPSLGKFYDGTNGPADGRLNIRVMTGEEEQILATPRFNKKGTAMNMIFDRCIKECGSNSYRSENFLTVDRTFLLIWLRGISYGTDYSVEVTCPFTDKKFTESVDLNLDVDNCPDNFSPDDLYGQLPQTGYNFRYKLATGLDEQRIVDYREKRTKFDGAATQADDTLLYRTALLIEDIEGLTNKHEIQQLLKKLPMKDVTHLRNLTTEPPFGVNTRVEITSPYTMEEFEIDLPLESNFFFPRQRRTRTQA